MIDNSIENLFTSINSSKEYNEYQKIVSVLREDQEVNTLIEEIKKLEKEATRLEYKNDDKYKEIDNIIKEKAEKLNSIPTYREYLLKLKDFNNMLMASSSMLEEYIDDKVSI